MTTKNKNKGAIRTPSASGQNKNSIYRAPKKIKDAVRSLVGKAAIITFHSLGDLDACASALALSHHLGKDALVAPPDRTNSESRRILGNALASTLSFEEARKRFPEAPIILLDANDRSILPQFAHDTDEGENKLFLIIDHHASDENSVHAKNEWIVPDSPSTCELVGSLIDKVDAQEARWLILGILSDSAGLVRANSKTFATMAKLLEKSDLDYENMLSSLEQPSSSSSRAIVLEGLRQAVWLEKEGFLIATAMVSSHESHVADALVGAGADVAFVGTQDKKGSRISARLRPALAEKIDLPLVMKEVGRVIDGDGGGHSCAAGASGPRWDRLEGALMLAQRLFFERVGKTL